MSHFISKSLTIFSVTFALVSAASASSGTDVGYLFGVKSANFSSTASAGPTFTAEAGVMAGAIAVGDLSGDLKFRAGGYYTQRTAKSSLNSLTSTITFSYLDVPVTVLYKFNDMVGVFGGLDFGMKISDSCSGSSSTCTDPNGGYQQPSSFISAIQVGLNAKFHPNWAGEIFYEAGLSNVSQATKENALSAALMFIY